MSADTIEWRIGEVYDPVNTPLAYVAGTRYVYEIEPVWETDALSWGGAATSTAVPVSALVPKRTYRARVRHRATNGRWSSWSDGLEFQAGAAEVATYQAGLVVSELMYHPKDASVAEIGAGYENSDFEYIEFYNAGPVALDLSEVQFTDGIAFAFAGSAITSLGPGDRVLVVRNLAAFESRYGGVVPVAGEFPDSSFSNDGELVEVSIGIGSPILSFTYNDQPPWPTGADDGLNGFPLVLVEPSSLPDHSLPESWTAGSVAGGNPGGPDFTGFALWLDGFSVSGAPGDDPNDDGVALLLEYVFAGGSPLVRNSTVLPTLISEELDVGAGLQAYAVFELTIRAGLSDVSISVETSGDLGAWASPGLLVFLEEIDHGDGTLTLRYRSSDPLAAGGARFFARARVSLGAP